MSYKKLLTFAIGSYLMLRIDYVVICRDELEAKILRIIEMYMEMERARIYQETVNVSTGETDEELEITKDIWVAISHRLFTRDLYQLVKSENTLKRAIKSLIDKGFVLVRAGNGKYDPMQYQLNTAKIQAELDKLAQLGIAGYQKLIPSKTDTIKNRHPETQSRVSNSEVSKIEVSNFDPHSRSNTSRIEASRTDNEEEEGEGEGAALDALTPPASADILKEKIRQQLSDPALRAVTQTMLAEDAQVPGWNEIDADWQKTTAKREAVRIGGGKDGQVDAAVHDAGARGAAASDASAHDMRLPDRPAPGVAPADFHVALGPQRAAALAVSSTGATSNALQPQTGTVAPPQQTVRGATDALGSPIGGAAPALVPVAGTSPGAGGLSGPRASGASVHKTSTVGAKQAPLSLRDEAPRPPSEKVLRARYEAHFWQLLEDIRKERGLVLPAYGKTWKGLRENQEGINAFYADAVSDEAIRAGYVAMLESADGWLRNNFTVMAFFKRLQGLLDGKNAPAASRAGNDHQTRPARINFTRERQRREASA